MTQHLLRLKLMTTFEWAVSPRGFANYTYHENTEELSRSIGIAGVLYDSDRTCYRVHLSYHFTELVPLNAYIRKHKYPTLEAAKRAVERKVPPLIAVLKIQGRPL
jgi:hypothetical protein